MCGPAVKPIALAMVAEIARDPQTAGLPISAIGGVTTWRDAAEFIALGADNVQVCTAAMTYGFKIVEEMISGLKTYMDGQGLPHESRISAAGRSAHVTDWQYLNLNYVAKARDQPGSLHQVRPLPHRLRGHVASGDLRQDQRRAEIRRQSTPNASAAICASLVCPVEDCITLVHKTEGVDPRTGRPYTQPPLAWTAHPNNPGAESGGGGVGRRAVIASQSEAIHGLGIAAAPSLDRVAVARDDGGSWRSRRARSLARRRRRLTA